MNRSSPSGPEIPAQREVHAGAGRHFIICGDTALAFRLAEELATRHRTDVTVILANRRVEYGPRIAKLRRVHVREAPELDADTFRSAGLATADAVAFVHADDLRNVYAALQAQEVRPGVRLVLRVFNSVLGQRLGQLFTDAQVLSDVEIATPAFVAAALGLVDSTVVRIGNRLARVTASDAVVDGTVLCGLAVTSGAGTPLLLPDESMSPDLMLVLDDEPVEEYAHPDERVRPSLRRLVHNVRHALSAGAAGPLVSFGVKVTLAVLGSIVAVGVGVYALLDRHATPLEDLYLMLFTSVGAGQTDLTLSVPQQIVQTIVTLAGVAMIPVVSAAIVQAGVHARIALPPGALIAPERDHVVVVGIGNIGTRVLRALHERGVAVVAIDHTENPYGAQYVREKRVHFIQGDASRESTLRRANVANAAALVVLTSDDVTNLEYALQGRQLHGKLRVVLRLFDGDFADRVNRTFDITTSRSVSFLAAPAFAAAMMGREVIGTIPVKRHVLLVADVPVSDGSWLTGRLVADVHGGGEVRIIALVDGATGGTVWSPGRSHELADGDRLIVLATPIGLSRVIGQSAASGDTAAARRATAPVVSPEI